MTGEREAGLLSITVRRRTFLAGMAAAIGGVAAGAAGWLAWRSGGSDEEAVTDGTRAGIFGEWVDAGGLPALRYTLDHRTDPRAEYVIRDGVTSRLNWHHLGNDATTAIAANDGWVQLFDYSHGARWMNYWDPDRGHHAGGFGYVFEAGKVTPTLYLDADPSAPAERVFGTGYYDTTITADDLEIDRRVTLPFGGATWLLSRVTLRNKTGRARSLRHFEYWDVNPRWLAFGASEEQRMDAAEALDYDVTASIERLMATEQQTAAADALRRGNLPRVPPQPGPTLFLTPLGATPISRFDTDPAAFFGSGGRTRPDAVAAGACTGSSETRRPCFVYQSDVELPANGEVTLWFAYGYFYDSIPELPGDPAAAETASLDAWRRWLPTFTMPDHSALCRELTWHAYSLRASSLYDAYFRRRTISQGFWYLYGSGFNAGLRDSAQHALPLVYFEPELARDVLLSILAQSDASGHFPYSMTGYGVAYDFIWRPGDYDIWTLWIASEYVLATRDTSVLDEQLAYYPPAAGNGAPVWDHLVLAFRHLVDVVGVGASGLLHARNADWNDGLVFEAAPKDIAGFVKDGESTLASAFAAWVMPQFANVARLRGESALADEVDAFASGLKERLQRFWSGQWLARAVLPNGDVYGTDRLHLEPQPWAIVSGVTDEGQTDTVLAQIDLLLREGSVLGARLLSSANGDQPSGESTQGGVWLSITHTLIWAAAQRKPEMAWDEFLRNTLLNHTAHYPEIWVGAWSGPDAYNSDWSPRAGWTWDLPALNVYGQIWPIQNVHVHSQPLLSFLRLAGVEPTAGGIRIAPAFPFKEWSVSSPAFSLEYGAGFVAGRMRALGDEMEVRVRVPDSFAGRALTVTGSAREVGHEVVAHEVDGTDVVLRLQGAAGGQWDWRIAAA